jgi:hypothetical protein
MVFERLCFNCKPFRLSFPEDVDSLIAAGVYEQFRAVMLPRISFS